MAAELPSATPEVQYLAEREEERVGEGGDDKLGQVLPPLPPNLYEELPEPPSEPSGIGVNKKVNGSFFYLSCYHRETTVGMLFLHLTP